MTSEPINEKLEALRQKEKSPRNRSVLDSWIARAEGEIDSGHQGRLGWLIATTVATAALQRVVDESDSVRFSLKGGTLLQHRLGLASRSTKDLDGIVRGDIDEFLVGMDEVLREDWGPIHFSRSEIEEIVVPSKLVNPRRFELIMSIKGQTWRKVTIEISPDEGLAASSQEPFKAPPLDRFGLPSIDALVGLALSYQIAQKIHASTDPHNPPDHINNRARDIVDLLLLRELVFAENSPSLKEIKAACIDIFEARALEAEALGRIPRKWAPEAQAYSHWKGDYLAAAEQCDVSESLDEAIAIVNSWIKEIDQSS